jgi:hypothetical protein
VSPYPAVRDAQTERFFDGTAAGQLLVLRCPSCDRYQPYETVTCRSCSHHELDWVPAVGRATLVSWTIAHKSPPPSGEPGGVRCLGLAELDEGPWLSAPLLDIDTRDLRVGAPLSVTFIRPGSGEHIPAFHLSDPGAATATR